MNVPDEKTYGYLLDVLIKSEIPFIVGGAFALGKHTGIWRETKDIDIFLKPGDSTRLIKYLTNEGFRTEITDARWLAKAFRGKNYIDIIFGSINGITPVDDTWIDNAYETEIFERKVKVIAPEELIWAKAFVQERTRYDGADINHIIFKKGKAIDWKRLLGRMDKYWEILFSIVLNYRFVYPAARSNIPKFLLLELTERLMHEISLPDPKDEVCMGPLLSRTQYEVDIKDWGINTIT